MPATQKSVVITRPRSPCSTLEAAYTRLEQLVPADHAETFEPELFACDQGIEPRLSPRRANDLAEAALIEAARLANSTPDIGILGPVRAAACAAVIYAQANRLDDSARAAVDTLCAVATAMGGPDLNTQRQEWTKVLNRLSGLRRIR